MRLLLFHSTSRDDQLTRNLQLVETRPPTGRFLRHHNHLHNFRDHQCQRTRYHPKYLRTRLRGAFRLPHLPHLTFSYLLAPDVAWAAVTSVKHPPFTSHPADQSQQYSNSPSTAGAGYTVMHTIPFHYPRLWRGSSRRQQMVHRQSKHQSFQPG